ALKRAMPRIHDLVYHKFYVDEMYGFLVIKPLRFVSDKVLFQLVDAGLIDGVIVNGSANASYSAGKALAKVQNGRLDIYALIFAIGVALMLYWAI
ncbi:MAG: NADH-quinone oxidoreductase subunit L, partial [Elusimicrobiota bacterium]|nr:NADH-quinone oxidoreductase subunit L [Elusimicrobiota bacterium]